MDITRAPTPTVRPTRLDTDLEPDAGPASNATNGSHPSSPSSRDSGPLSGLPERGSASPGAPGSPVNRVPHAVAGHHDVWTPAVNTRSGHRATKPATGYGIVRRIPCPEPGVVATVQRVKRRPGRKHRPSIRSGGPSSVRERRIASSQTGVRRSGERNSRGGFVRGRQPRLFRDVQTTCVSGGHCMGGRRGNGHRGKRGARQDHPTLPPPPIRSPVSRRPHPRIWRARIRPQPAAVSAGAWGVSGFTTMAQAAKSAYDGTGHPAVDAAKGVSGAFNLAAGASSAAGGRAGWHACRTGGRTDGQRILGRGRPAPGGRCLGKPAIRSGERTHGYRGKPACEFRGNR